MTSTAPPSAADNDTARTARTTLRQWSAVAVLSLSTFTVVTSEMLPVGVLTPMAEGLGVSSGTAGFSLTATGLVAAVTAPVVPRFLGALDRRTVLAAAMLVLAAGNALTAFAQGFALLIAARVVLGLGMGTVWGLAAAVAPRLVAPRNAALAVSFAVSGVAAASVAGVPLGTVIGDAFGWRAAFGALSAAAVVLAAGLVAVPPRLPRPASAPAAGADAGGRSPLPPAVATGLIVVTALVTAHFAAYTYVRPVLEEHGGLAPSGVAFLLLVYGLFGLAGNFAAGALAARRPRATVLVLAGGIGAAIVLLVLLGSVGVFAGAAIALWGLAYGGVSVAGQIWMTRAAPHRVEQVTGLYVGVFTAAIALGAFAGGTAVEAAGIMPLLWGAAALAFASLAVGLFGPGPAPLREGSEEAGEPAGGRRRDGERREVPASAE
ncbi:MFS transporter [Nocardiopsis potens]|uniref:MFS transporter n=1 Tax=Nocardiopsis potens TaxID=1246458 RepID=UPI00034BDC7C|nr:MFS transporter [Nocardiopsis potens]